MAKNLKSVLQARKNIRKLDPFKSTWTRVYSSKVKKGLGVRNPKTTKAFYNRKEDSFYTQTKKGYIRKIPVKNKK